MSFPAPALEIFLTKLSAHIQRNSMVRLVLGKPRSQSSGLQKLIITLVDLKGGQHLKFVYRYPTKDVTRNFEPEEGIRNISDALTNDFFNADLFTTTETLQLTTSRKNKVKLAGTAVATPPVLPDRAHDHTKRRLIDTSGNIYLRELGILNADFQVRKEMNDKYIQVNRYIELLDPVFRDMNLAVPFHIADMGSGKGYLTFALYDYLSKKPGYAPVITGVESRENLVAASNEIAAIAGFDHLKFITGTIKDVKLERIDALIALHACDTATDDAIFRGISAGAALIVVAPCCHKQIRKEFNVTNVLKEITRHGILEERQAEIITDAVRAMIMEAYGYKTSVFEFVSTEHTPKNLMIIGKKSGDNISGREIILKKISDLKNMYGIRKHYLEEII